MTPPFSSKFAHAAAAGKLEVGGGGVGAGGAAVRESRSPVSFREGRRASDGAMLGRRGGGVVVAFRQQLRDTTKTRGVAELRQDAAASAAPTPPSRGRIRQLSLDGSQPPPAVDDRPPKLGTKRRSYPSSADSPVDDEPARIGGGVAAAGGCGYAARGAAAEPAAAAAGGTAATGGVVVFPVPRSAGESLHQNIVQTRLHQLLQSARPSTSQPQQQHQHQHHSASVAGVSELHHQLHQLHVSTSASAASQDEAATLGAPGGSAVGGAAATAIYRVGRPHLHASPSTPSSTSPQPAADAEVPGGAPGARGVGVGGAAATAIFHSTVVPPRLMRRHFVRQSSHKMAAPPLSTTAGLTIDDDVDVLQWQAAGVCDLLPPPQLSPTFEETNEDEDAPAAPAATD